MPRYSYTAKSLTGEPHSGASEAKDEHDLARILKREGFILISAALEKKAPRKKKFSLSALSFGGVSVKEKIFFTRNLRVMVAAGVSLPRALQILANQSKKKKFQNAILDVRQKVIQGKSFSSALAIHPAIFSELFFNMVKVGEEAGTLEEALKVLTRQMEREYDLKSNIKGALMYPAVIVSVMVLIGILMLILVVPKLAETFADLGIELPLTTQIVIVVGTLLANFWYLLPLVLVILLVLLRMALKTAIGKRIRDTLFLKIPVIKSLVRKTNAAYMTRTLGSLIAAGVPIVRSLEIIAGAVGNIYYKEAIIQAAEHVKKGSKLAEAFSSYEHLYPVLVIQMIEVGEETGETSSMLQQLADFFEEEVERTTKNLSSIIEPILMLMVGAAVGFFAISMLQPMYSLISDFQ